jgi:hypothetical protein
MQNKFLSKSVPRGTRTIWRYLGALFILFTFAIGQMWAADITVTPPTPNNASNPFSTGLYVMSFTGTGSKLSSGAITTGTKGAVITINFQATKSDMYIKTITFNSLKNGTLSSDDGTFDGQVFTATGNKNSVNVVLTSGSGQKGTVKVTNVVVNTGTNVVETITFTGVDSGDGQKATFTSSVATSALSSITTDASAFSVSSGKLSWTNGKKVILTAESNIKYVAFSIADGKMYGDKFSATEDTYNDANYTWSGSSKTVTLTNGSGGGHDIKGLYVIIDPVVKHHVTYSLGGDYGTTPTQADVAEGGKFTLHDGTTGITAPENKTFAGWNDGTTTYEGGAEYTMGTSDVELTAQWATSYDISYDNGTYGIGEIAGGKKAEDVAYTLSSSMFTRENYLQVGWATSDGASRSYMIGGSYTTNAAQTFYPAWAEKDTYVAAFAYDSENPAAPAGWTFANAGTYTNTSATVAYVGKFKAEGETTASGKGMNLNHIAFAKSADADAVYDLGYATTVSAVTGTLMIGSTSDKVATIDYLAADGSTVLHSFNIIHNKTDWGANNFNETEVVPNVRYIRINGKDFWQVLGAFSVTYGSLVTKYNVTFDKNNEGASGTQATLKYAEGAEVTLPATSTFTAPTNMEFDAWTSTDVTISNNKFTMPGNDVVIKATWKYLPKLRLEAGEGATGDPVETYHKAGSSVAVPAKPEGFSNGTKEFTGWVYSTPVEITDGAFPMPSSDLTLTAQWASATAVAQIVGGDSYETLAEAIADAEAGQTIQLLQNIEQADGVLINKNLVLDLNGKTYTCTNGSSYNNRAIKVTAGNVTITNGTITAVPTANFNGGCYGGLRIEGESANVTCTNVTFNNGRQYGLGIKLVTGQLRMEECTVNSANGGGGLEVAGTADVINCTFTQTGLDPQAWISTCLAVCYGGELNVQGGTYTSEHYSLYVYSSGGEMDVENGTFTGNIVNTIDHNTYPDATGTINISGGTFEGVGDAPIAFSVGANYTDINISGGTFDAPVENKYCAENYAPKDNGDGTYGVKPLATSIDFEGYYVDGSHGTVAEALAAHNYTLTADMSDNKKVAWDNNTNAYDKGLKIKEDAKTFSFEVAAGKLVAFKTGIISGATLSVNGGAVDDLTITAKENASIKTRYYYNAAVQNFVFTTTTASYNIIKSVTIEDPYVVTFNANGGEDVTAMEFHGTALTLPSATKGTEVFKGWYDAAEGGNLIGKANDSYTPTASVTLYAQWEAVSSDATLSALEVDGATVAGFDPETYIYNIVCEYGHTPEITLATATAGTLATVTINNTPVDEGTYKYVQVKVVPQSGEEGKKFYQVRYTNKPKQGVTLIKATHTGAKTAEVTGYLGGTYDKNTASDGKLGDANTYFGIKLTEGNFQAGDVLYIHASTVSSAVRIYSDKGTTRINAEDGTFDANKMFTYTLTAETEWIYIYRKVKDGESDMNPYVDYIEVQRHMAPFIESFEIEGIGALDINPTTKAITASVPESFDVTALTPTIKAWANGSAHLDKSGAKDFTNPVTYNVTSDYAEDGEVTYTVTITKVAPSATPVIATQPAGDSYVEGASVEALTVAAEPTAGTLSYQWQVKNGEEWENIDGATAASYTPAVSAIGSYTYRVVVTNTEESKPATSVNSNEATIVIAEDPSCKAIGYGTTRDLALNTEVVIDAITGLKHKSSKDAVDDGRKIKNVSDIDGIKLDGNAYYDIYTTEKNIGSIAVSLTSNSNGTNRKFAVIFCSAAEFDAAKILGVVEQTGGAGDEEQVINTPDVPLGTKLVRIMRYYKDANNNEYGEGSSSWIYYARVCLVEPAQEVTASVADEPASANYCPSDVVAPLAYELSMEAGASAAYQWYKGTEAIEGATDATYTPSETGVYSCKAVVTKTGRLNKKLTSAEATVNFYEATKITGFENAAAPLNTEKTLSVTAAGTGTLTYKWQACTEAGVVTDENVLSSVATYGVIITEEPQYYLVTVEGECGSATQVLFAKKWADLELVDVDGSMTWNFAASNTGITGDVAVPSTMVLANAGQGAMPNTDNFHSDMLKAIVGTTGTAVRKSTDDGCYQGDGIMFHTTVPGIVTVTYRGTGNNADVTLTVGSKTFDTYHGGFTTCDKVFVPAGDVVISSVGTMRIQKIVFNAKADYTRDVTEGRYGTICLPKAGVMTGATLYEVAYYGATSKKIFFDEVLNGEMQAGVPYIFLPEEGADQLGVFYTNDAVETAKSANGLVGFIGANKEDAQEVPVGSYILSNNQYRKVVYAQSAYIKSNRSYIDLSAINPSEPTLAPGRRRISMSVQGEQTATDIDNIFGNDTKAEKVLINGQLFILRGGKMFDAAGQLVK